MKEFSCGAVVPNCDAKFTAESESEIMAQVADHARSAHGMDDVPPEVVDKVRLNIHETA